MRFAIVNRYRNNTGVLTVRYVYAGFATRDEAESYNEEFFATPAWNVIVPMESR